MFNSCKNLLEFPERHIDDFGREIYYQVGDRKTMSKILALEWANGDINSVSFHWKENEFDFIDWTKEPNENLTSMVDSHVVALRDSHDHVAIWYSGGYDSHTIVEAFRRNRLRVDELIVFDRDWYHDIGLEETNLACKFAQWYKINIWPDIKITRISWRARDVIKFYRNRGLDWIYHTGDTLRFSKHSRNLVYRINPAVAKLNDRPMRAIQINGLDKPRLDFRDGTWYATRLDQLLYMEIDDHCHHLWFEPKLYVKQCWMMLRWFESLPGANHETLHRLVHDVQSFKTSHLMYQQWNLAIGRDIVWSELCRGHTTKTMKTSIRNSPESQELQKAAQTDAPDVWKIYDLGVSWVEQKFKHLVDSTKGIPNIMSKPYFISRYGSTISPTLTREDHDIVL